MTVQEIARGWLRTARRSESPVKRVFGIDGGVTVSGCGVLMS
jgi:hypothetical protein